mmetsp:Transcript_23814/g.60127  ORF Transcript_23814/g.60127 Transcript_23814/m.60127 type:complete len:97 (-) Transcript_23814:311-601(-)
MIRTTTSTAPSLESSQPRGLYGSRWKRTTFPPQSQPTLPSRTKKGVKEKGGESDARAGLSPSLSPLYFWTDVHLNICVPVVHAHAATHACISAGGV